MTTLATTAFALLLTFGGTASASRYSPPRTGLQLIDAPSTLNTILSYPCEYDSTKTCTGIEHSEALFGVPKYGRYVIAEYNVSFCSLFFFEVHSLALFNAQCIPFLA